MIGANPFRLSEKLGERCPIGHAGGGDDGATSMPALSMRMWRLMPSTFFAPSKPRGPATGDALTLGESGNVCARLTSPR
jgi:hypothetical protein